MLLYVLVMGCCLTIFHVIICISYGMLDRLETMDEGSGRRSGIFNVIVCISYGMLVDYMSCLLYVLVMGC